MAQIVMVALLLDVEGEAEAYDAVNEILREVQRTFTPDSCLIDYAMPTEPRHYALSDDYEEGEFFAAVNCGDQA